MSPAADARTRRSVMGGCGASSPDCCFTSEVLARASPCPGTSPPSFSFLRERLTSHLSPLSALSQSLVSHHTPVLSVKHTQAQQEFWFWFLVLKEQLPEESPVEPNFVLVTSELWVLWARWVSRSLGVADGKAGEGEERQMLSAWRLEICAIHLRLPEEPKALLVCTTRAEIIKYTAVVLGCDKL